MNVPEKIAKIIAQPMHFLSRIASPFVWLLSASTQTVVRITGISSKDNKITEEEIKAIIQEGTEGGEIQEVEQDIVERVFNLGDRNIGSLMTYRNDMIRINTNDSLEAIRTQLKKNVFTVYPVARDELDNITGIVYLKDLFVKIDAPDFKLEEHPSTGTLFPRKSKCL